MEMKFGEGGATNPKHRTYTHLNRIKRVSSKTKKEISKLLAMWSNLRKGMTSGLPWISIEASNPNKGTPPPPPPLLHIKSIEASRKRNLKLQRAWDIVWALSRSSLAGPRHQIITLPPKRFFLISNIL